MRKTSNKELNRRELCGNALADFYGDKNKEDAFEFQRIRKALWSRTSKGLSPREKHIYYEVVMNMSDPSYNNALRELANFEMA